jgi:hypothetical protein
MIWITKSIKRLSPLPDQPVQHCPPHIPEKRNNKKRMRGGAEI